MADQTCGAGRTRRWGPAPATSAPSESRGIARRRAAIDRRRQRAVEPAGLAVLVPGHVSPLGTGAMLARSDLSRDRTRRRGPVPDSLVR